MRKSREQNAVNGGSLADIAFLLLIFFLVATTIPNDEGIPRKLPPTNEDKTIPEFKERNVLNVFINKDDELLVKDRLVHLKDLRLAVKRFVDNNGSGNCNYCSGIREVKLSEKPQLAVVSLKADREASYKFYVAVQNELTGAYKELRAQYAANVFHKTVEALDDEERDEVRNAYPMLISEAEIAR
ncbi:ExbD/TolR family protein [Flavobacteriaceae bacterium M23B6Z8]